MGWALAALLVVFWGLRLWTGSTSVAWANPAALAFVLAGLVAGAWVLAARGQPNARTQAAIMCLLGAAIACWAYVQVLQAPAYGTDELAFDQYAARLLVHGTNPYTHSLLPALQRYLVPPIYHTYLLNGQQVSRLSYPALSFLAYAPALLLGLHHQAAVFTDLAAWVAAFLLLWRLMPVGARWVAGPLLGLVTYANFVVGGVTDALFVPFVFLAVWRWDRYGHPDEPGCARWLSPLALGLAMSVKQTPWFLLPFLLVALAWESNHRGSGRPLLLPLRYFTVAVGVFAAVNAPFVVAAPSAWLHGVLLPLRSPSVPGGQGIIDLALFERAGGNLHSYLIAAALALLTALAAFAAYYPTLKRAWMPLVALVFFWPTRSFASYLIDLTPAALLAAITVQPLHAAVRLRGRRLRSAVVVVTATAFLATLVLAVSAAPALGIELVGFTTTGQLRTIDGIELRVRNHTDRPLEPHFAVLNGGYLTSFWYPIGASARQPLVVPAHASRRVLLRAPNPQSMPSLDGGFVVDAFTARPATASASTTIPPSNRRLALFPDAINRPVPVGHRLSLEVQLVDRLGNPLRHAGVPVSLGQVVYGQEAVIPGEASIDNHPEGQTPITDLTNAQGRVHFTIVGKQAQAEPDFFQAWIAAPNRPPVGFSNLLSIQFDDTPHA